MPYKDKLKAKELAKAKYQANKAIIREKQKEYYLKNKEKILEHNKEYVSSHKKDVDKYKLEWARINKKRIALKRLSNPEILRKDAERKRKWNIKNRLRLSKKFKEYALKNKEKKMAYDKEYVKKNKDLISLKHKEYREKNKEIINKKNIEYRRKRRAKDPFFKLVCSLRRRVKNALKKGYKGGTTMELLGAPWQVVMDYLTSLLKPGMTWENYGAKTWHLDHKIPISHYDLNDFEQQKLAFNYKNMEPLWAIDNLKKWKNIDYIPKNVNPFEITT